WYGLPPQADARKPVQHPFCRRRSKERGGERQVVYEVSLGQAIGFLDQPVTPLQPGLLHPIGSTASAPAEEIEADADAHPPGFWEQRTHFRNQPFLLG